MGFRTTLIVRFGDVDSAGIVYYPRYAHYLHIGMERYFAEVVGIDYSELTVERRYGLPTVRLEVDYRQPFRYGDRVSMEIDVGRIVAQRTFRLVRDTTLLENYDKAYRLAADVITDALENLQADSRVARFAEIPGGAAYYRYPRVGDVRRFAAAGYRVA